MVEYVINVIRNISTKLVWVMQFVEDFFFLDMCIGHDEKFCVNFHSKFVLEFFYDDTIHGILIQEFAM